MVALSVPEVWRLVGALAGPPGERAHHLHWSRWRRTHQATARHGHAARRARDRPSQPVSEPPVIAVPRTPALTDALWARVAPLLPPARGKTGRPPGAQRPLLEGVLWLMRTGAGWREIPEAHGPWQTVYSRYQRWRRSGLWACIVGALHGTASDATLPT